MKISNKAVKYYWYFGLILAILLLTLGVILLVSNYFQYIPTNIRIILGLFILSYGAFRLVNILPKLKNKEYENNEDE